MTPQLKIQQIFLGWKRKKKASKNRIVREIRNLFENEQGYYYKPVRVGNFWSDNYIEYESNDNRNKNTTSWRVEEYLNKIINDHK